MMKYTVPIIMESPNGTDTSAVKNCIDEIEFEFIRNYGTYSDDLNEWVIVLANREFNKEHPGYFEENSEKKWTELSEYNHFMSDFFQKKVVDFINCEPATRWLTYFVDPDTVDFRGRFVGNPDIIFRIDWDAKARLEELK